jgi:hypothetical protein
MKNILLVLISFVIIGCTTVSPITNTVDLTNTDFINAKDFKEGKACEIYLIGFIGPFGNAQIIKAIQENYIKKVYAVDRYYANYLFVQEICVFVYGEEMTRPEKIERKIHISEPIDIGELPIPIELKAIMLKSKYSGRFYRIKY